MNDKLVSVIISTYKREPSVLNRAIQSVLNQTYTEFELIIVNDDPDPIREKKIREFVNEIDSGKIRYICNEKNSGACVSRNRGIKNSNGYYIALLDDDDEWKPDKLECMLPYFAEHIGLVYSAYDVYRGKEFIRRNGQALSENPYVQLLKWNFIGGCSIPIILRECFEKCGYFDESLPSSQDIDMWRRIAERYQIAYVDKSTVNYFVMSESITRNIDSRVKGWLMELEKFSQQYSKHQKERDFNYKMIVTTLIAYGNYSQGIKMFEQAFNRSIWCRVLNSPSLLKGIVKRLIFIIRGYV